MICIEQFDQIQLHSSRKPKKNRNSLERSDECEVNQTHPGTFANGTKGNFAFIMVCVLRIISAATVTEIGEYLVVRVIEQQEE